MKILLTICFGSVSLFVVAQDNFSKQIRAIVNDTSNKFKNVRGHYNPEPKIDFGIPYYSPKSDIDGTEINKIFYIEYNSYYHARVINSNSKDSVLTDSLLDVWIKKITSILGDNFTFGKASHPPGLKAFYIKRYKFSHGHLSIFLSFYRPYPDDRTNNVIRIDFEYKPKD